MSETTDPVIPYRDLFGPGPTNVPDSVLIALAQPTIGHLDPVFLDTMDHVVADLRTAFVTENPVTFVMSAPGSIGMEASLVNLVEPGDTVIICINGVFGGRMQSICERIGAKVVVVEDEWGTPVDPDKLEQALKANPDCGLVGFVHAETSTGVRSDAKTLASLAKQHDCLVVADTVTSLSGVELRVDEWQLDAVYSGSQKCLSCVPGLAPITFSQAAIDKAATRKTPVQSWFCDTNLLAPYYTSGESKRAYHHTAPVNSLFAMREALRLVVAEGLEQRWQRHQAAAAHLYARLEGAELSLVVAPEHRLSPLTLVSIPDYCDDAKVRGKLLGERSIELGAGLGKFAGKAWRIGLMGHNATVERADFIADALIDAMR
ncbi:MAG: alanine--glyoxylate aminotransferase family protein [Pseudomonadota bacterium]